jgi:hypothetical protein
MPRDWVGDGPAFKVDWNDQTWSLKVDDHRPGLRPVTEGIGPLLALEGVAEAGRWASEALSGATLVRYERRFNRVEATYAPLGWGALYVRAAWTPTGVDGIDLEIQLHALSVGQLRAVEVKLLSQFAEPETSIWQSQRWVEPRDARSAALSYDGREPDLRGLTTLPPREAAFHSPRLVPSREADGWLYAEMVHPGDASRRIREGGRNMALARTTRYGLFGYDVEKGVVFRARLRGVWLRSETAKGDALDRFEEFVQEPLPLST